MKILGLFLLAFYSSNAYGVISQEVVNYEGETRVDLVLPEGDTKTETLNILSSENGDEVRRARIVGSGLSGDLSSCERVYNSSLGQSCSASIDISSTAQGSKRIILYTSAGRKTLTINIQRQVNDNITETDYQNLLNFVGESTPLDLGTVNGANQNILKQYYLTNTGSSFSGEITAISLNQTSAMNVVSQNCLGKNLAPNQNCRITLRLSSSRHNDGNYSEILDITNSSNFTKSIQVLGEITGNPQVFSEVEVALTKSLDPSDCLNEGGDPALCYYEADVPSGGQGETSAVSCNQSTNQCFVQTSFQVPGEPTNWL